MKKKKKTAEVSRLASVSQHAISRMNCQSHETFGKSDVVRLSFLRRLYRGTGQVHDSSGTTAPSGENKAGQVPSGDGDLVPHHRGKTNHTTSKG